MLQVPATQHTLRTLARISGVVKSSTDKPGYPPRCLINNLKKEERRWFSRRSSSKKYELCLGLHEMQQSEPHICQTKPPQQSYSTLYYQHSCHSKIETSRISCKLFKLYWLDKNPTNSIPSQFFQSKWSGQPSKINHHLFESDDNLHSLSNVQFVF